MSAIQKTPIIKWLSDFYNWEPCEHEFKIQDYVNINGSAQFVRVDPAVASKAMWKAEGIDMFAGKSGKGFYLYQCDSPSKIRAGIPLRFFL